MNKGEFISFFLDYPQIIARVNLTLPGNWNERPKYLKLPNAIQHFDWI